MRKSTKSEGFSLGELARLSGVKPRTLDHWAATGFLRPSIRKAEGTGTKRVYSFSDAVAARAVRELRDAGVSLQSLRKVVSQLRKLRFTDRPLSEVRLIVSGKDVCLKDNQHVISMLRHPGQAFLPFTVLDLPATVEAIQRGAVQIKAKAA
jgi:DNA-binding transcriptional MerR regulator